MKKINKLVALFLTLFVFVACDKEEELLSINDKDIKTSVSVSEDNLALQKDNVLENALTITMAEPTFGVSVTPSYKLSLMVGDKESKISLPANKLEKVFSSVDLNKLVLDLGATAEEETEVTIVGIVELGTKKILSEKKTIKVTPYAVKLDLTTTWGIVGTPNDWGQTGIPDLPMYKNTENPEEMVAYVTLGDGEIKFRQNNTWGGDYGGSGELSGTLTTGGGNNIKVTAGTYKIAINLTALTYKIEPFTWGIVGTPNNWGQDGADIALKYDPTSDMWKTVVKLKEGEIKFRKNNAWGGDFGGSGELSGTLTTGGNNNIAVKAGNYLVEVSFKDNTYKLTKIDFIWGIVGTINEWGNTGIPDVKMSMDYSKEGVWYAKLVVVKDGKIKFRANEGWTNNYGDDGADGSLESGGADIVVTAGTYDVVLDLSNAEAPTYTLKKVK